MWHPPESQLKLLRYIQLQARATAGEISRACGIKEHTVFYAMRLFREKRLLVSRPMINYSRLGYTEYDLYLRISGSAATSRAHLLRWAEAVRNVVLLLEVGGEYQYEVVLVARNISELERSLEALAGHLGNVALHKSMSIRASTWLFGTKCLCPFRKPLPKLGYSSGNDCVQVSELDIKLLAGVHWLEEFNVSHVARELNESASTIEYRLRRLEEKGVIVGYYYDYGMLNEALGHIGFHLLIRLKGSAGIFAKKFFEYCWKHPNIDRMHKGIGSFDYKLEARVPSYDVLVTLVDDIYERFEASVADINIIPPLNVHRVSAFPTSAPADATES